VRKDFVTSAPSVAHLPRGEEMIWLPSPGHREAIDMRMSMYPSLMTCYHTDEENGFECGEAYATSFLYVLKGSVGFVQKHGPAVVVPAGSALSIPGVFGVVKHEDGAVFFEIRRLGYRGMWGLTRIEQKGRLAYIDGCTDTTLIQPPRLGDPVLNYLHFPPHINQTQHLHPSIRFGVVAAGQGIAWKQTTEHDEGWEIPLQAGGMFCLEESAIHSFRTLDSFMDIIAYHPDSDTGPSDQNHAMLNRTYINHGKK
jgi:hypothetical protein